MKLCIAFVVLGLVMGAQSSVIPILGHPLSYTAVHGPVLAVPAHLGSVAVHAPLVVAAAPVPAPVVVAAAPVQGTYVAQTLGSTHIAPLPGHANSASSVNLEPAPGTA